MDCLGAITWDPGTAVTKSLAAASAMAALDTTNLRLAVTVPADGRLMARIRVAEKGNASNPSVLMGVLNGTTVLGRQCAAAGRFTGATALQSKETFSLITGLTPGAITLDAAFACEAAFTSATLGWGGPNNAVATDAYGAACFELYNTSGMLAGIHYDPGTLASKSLGTVTAMAACDTTNLRLPNFTVPSSGRVLVRIRGCTTGNAGPGGLFLGVMTGSTVLFRQAVMGGNQNSGGTQTSSDFYAVEAMGYVTGLTPGSTASAWDAAWGCELAAAGAILGWGGPNNATAVDAVGGIDFEAWAA